MGDVRLIEQASQGRLYPTTACLRYKRAVTFQNIVHAL